MRTNVTQLRTRKRCAHGAAAAVREFTPGAADEDAIERTIALMPFFAAAEGSGHSIRETKARLREWVALSPQNT